MAAVNGHRWYGILGAMIGALIMLSLWVLSEVKAFRELSQEGMIIDVKTQGLVEKRYLELSGRIEKHVQRLNDQEKTDDILVDQMLKMQERLNIRPDELLRNQ